MFITKVYHVLLNRKNISCIRQLKRRFSKEKEINSAGIIKKLSEIPLSNIRNFSIIAHVDHGKSTLADRLLEVTGLLKPASSNKQVLDRLEVERERGITIKAQTASLFYSYQGQNYLLNLIDTPGHVDFSNEVSRSLAACQGVVLLVDANQGIQAQTVANFYLALEGDLVIIPCMNKIDLKNADPDGVANQLNAAFDIPPEDVLRVSAKVGTGVENLLETIIKKIPPPKDYSDKPFSALMFDSWFDKYKGVACLVTVRNGRLALGDSVKWKSKGPKALNYQVKGISLLRPPNEIPIEELCCGQVGVVYCAMRDRSEAVTGDSLVSSDWKPESSDDQQTELPPPQPVVFAGVYPVIASDHPGLRQAIEKLVLNDPAVSVSVDSSNALGQGWRLGFLGLLHMEVFSQRLETEFQAETIVTAPSVTYKAILHPYKSVLDKYRSTEVLISNPADLPDPSALIELQEPFVNATIISPDKYLGPVISLVTEARGVQHSAINIDSTRVMMSASLPLAEIVVDFHDKLKSVSSGFASFDYETAGYKPAKLVKVEILLNGDLVEELSFLSHISKAYEAARRTCLKLSEIVPRQQFLIAIQAKVKGKVIARENIKPYRKDVTAKLYGGDVTRRKKLLKLQAEGKQRLRAQSNIELPRDIFIRLLKR